MNAASVSECPSHPRPADEGKNTPLRLRALDPDYCMKARALRLGAERGARITRLDKGRLYAQLDIVFQERPQIAYWSIDDMCQFFFGNDRLPVDMLDQIFLYRITDDLISYSNLKFDDGDIRLDRVRGVVPGLTCQEYLFERQTECGKLYFLTAGVASRSTSAVRLPQFPVPLKWRVGRAFLNPTQLRRVNAGDVIRLCEWRPVVVAASLSLMTFTLDGDTAVIEAPLDESDADVPDVPMDAEQYNDGPLPLERIPVSCEFVLPVREFRLNELSTLEPGAVLPLDRSALRAVEMRVGRHRAALGELVQIGDEIGFEVSRIFFE